MGVFIQIEVEQGRLTSEATQKLVDVCPVDIFALQNDQLAIQPAQEDECTLCELCLEIAPAGALVIHKTYQTDPLVSRGP